MYAYQFVYQPAMAFSDHSSLPPGMLHHPRDEEGLAILSRSVGRTHPPYPYTPQVTGSPFNADLCTTVCLSVCAAGTRSCTRTTCCCPET